MRGECARRRGEIAQHASPWMIAATTGLQQLPSDGLPTTRVAVPLDMVTFTCGLITHDMPFASLPEMARLACAAEALLDCLIAILGDVEGALRAAAGTSSMDVVDESA